MTVYNYNKILERAKTCQTNVKKEYKTGISSWWSYYIAKQIINPKKDVTVINISDAPNPTGSSISRQIVKADYLDMCKRLIRFVETYKKMPNYVTYKTYEITPRLLTEILSRILIYYDTYKTLPAYANANSKVFTKPIESGNSVYDYFVQKTGKKFTTIDDLLEYVRKNFKYEFYFDDHKTNKQVTDSKAGNCTDLLQWLWNMAKAMGYDCKCIHVKCRVSGTGHVRGQFRHSKNTGGKWINRDIAAVADGGSVTSLWCADGYKIAENPSWFMQNINR